jgi:tetratricopeptide (TPR) repeat protein
MVAAVAEVLRRRTAAGRWLVIADNAVSPPDVRELAKAAGGDGQLLITSRDPHWSGVADAMELAVLPRPDSVALLIHHLPDHGEPEIGRLAEVLGDLPLALEQAGAWLAASAMTVQTYLELIERRTSQIMSEGTPADYPAPLAATWRITADNSGDPAALALMSLLAFFGPEPIPAELMASKEIAGISAELATITQDPIAYGRIIEKLSRLGLVRVSGDGLIVVHRLVQAVLRDYIPVAQRESLRGIVHRLLAAGDPTQPSDPATWPRYARLLPHALKTGLASSDNPACKLLILRLAWYLNARGDYINGAALARSALSSWTQALGEDHPDTIMAAANLAFTLQAQGNDTAAREIFQDTLARSRHVLGEDHPDTISIEHNFASTLHAQGDKQAAIEMFHDVLTRSRRVLGADHPDTILASASLAFILAAANNDETAQAISDRCQQVLGEDHPITINIAANRALALQAHGDPSEARSMLEALLSRSRRVLGEDHPVTFTIAANLTTESPPAPASERKSVTSPSRASSGPDTPGAIRYRTEDGLADYGFSFERRPNGEWRIYITSQPSYEGRDTSLHTTHRVSDGRRHYVCWTAPLWKLKDAKTVAGPDLRQSVVVTTQSL